MLLLKILLGIAVVIIGILLYITWKFYSFLQPLLKRFL